MLYEDDEPVSPTKTVKEKAIKKKVVAKDAPIENIMDKAVGYIKGSTDKRKAFDSVVSKYGEQLTEKQTAGLMKFVR